jgi:hypothetical protein
LLVIGAALSIWPRHLSPFPESQTAAPEHVTNLTVHGQVFRIKTPGRVTARDILVADGPEGFYWSLPQNPGETNLGYITEPAVIHYTSYNQQGSIDPKTARIIYSIPLRDIYKTGTSTGSLRLDKLVLRGKWLFYLYYSQIKNYDSEMKDAAQPRYVALGTLDTSSPYLGDTEDNVRFLYRGTDCGGGHLEWAASSDFVVWQQGWSKSYGGLNVTTSLYDLDTGLQRALPLPSGEMDELTFAGNSLQYRDGNSQGPYATLPLPPPGSGGLVPGAYWLPAVALGDAHQSLNQFQGTVYLPAAVNPAPFYQVEAAADASHYEVDFDAQEHPVPLNATDQERLELGGGPPCAGLLGLIAVYLGSHPQAVKELLAETLPQGQLFEIHMGKRSLTGHFLAPSSSSQVGVWWQDGSWRYRMLRRLLPMRRCRLNPSVVSRL